MRYWEKRAREWQKARDKKSAKLTADLVRAYRKAAEELQKEIFAWYEKYATADGVTLADAKKALSTDELKKLKRDLETFEKLAKENGKHAHDKVLTKMSAAVHVSRLESLQLQMRCILYELYKGVDDELTDTLKSFYADERERMAYETQLAHGEFEQIATTDEKRIERVLKTPWATDGKDFSSRLWTNREQLVGTLQAEITRALITGDDSASVGKAIAKKLNASLYAASRVAQTEITRVTTESDKDTFAEMDVEEVEVVGTLDLHTCGTCGDMDSKHMTRDEAVVGITAPPFHPNCRCQLVPYDKDFPDEYRLMRDPLTGKNKVIKNMSFNEWKEKYVTDEVKETLKALKPLKINRPRDNPERDYEKYAKILNGNMPSIEDFEKIRYNKDEWRMFKDYATGIKNGVVTPLADFALYKSISQETDDKLIGLTTSNGIQIAEKTGHFVCRVIGSVEQRRNGVQIDDIKEALTNQNAEVRPVLTTKAGHSQSFRLAGVEVSINPDTGKLIQANPIHTGRRKKT